MARLLQSFSSTWVAQWKNAVGEMDELWSFVDDQGNEQWVWLALDSETREIVGCYIKDRSGELAKALWQSLPAVYR